MSAKVTIDHRRTGRHFTCRAENFVLKITFALKIQFALKITFLL